MDAERLSALFAEAGAVGWGHVPFADLLPFMGEEAQAKAEHLCPGVKSVLVAAFSYYAGDAPGNICRYARGRDYHLVLTDRLGRICKALGKALPGAQFVPGSDNSPLPEREAARLAGLGLMGRNGMVILPPYGSWLVLGTVMADHAFDLPPAEPSGPCLNCGRCVAACPGGALRGDHFELEHCLSHLTQKKGDLPPEQAEAIARHPWAWGCDICQQVCPYNRGAVETSLPEFRENLLFDLTEDMVEGVTNRQFKERYGDRAFAWRGPAVIRRNLALRREAGER